MPRTINKYRCLCVTESAVVYTWNDNPPTVCPNNNTHAIDLSTITIVDSVNDTDVTISQDKGLTGGNFRCETVKAIIKPNREQTFDFVWPFDMAVSALHFVTNAQHIGDTITSLISPDTVVGYITQPVNIGDCIIHTNQTVIENLRVGYLASLNDGVHGCPLGYVTGIDAVNFTITTQKPSSVAFSADSPTYVSLDISNIHEFEIGDPNKYDIGQSLIQGGLIPANTVIRLIYKNNSKSDAKSFIFYFEYFY
jgi:hypothetical protein